MSKEIFLKKTWYVLLAAMSILTLLFFIGVRFVIMGINILVLDALTAAIWIFVRLCKWAGRENTGRRTVAVIAITLVGLFAAMLLMFGLIMYGGIYEYAWGTEPQTHRTFVVEYRRNMLLKGSAKVYERFGPLLFPCDVPEYIGPLNFDESDAEFANVHISEESQAIVVSLFTYGPRFYVPLKLPEGTAKTPERLLIEQPKDDDHDAFLVKTGGELGTLLVTSELERTPFKDYNSKDYKCTVHFSVWDPTSMDEPLQTLTVGTNLYQVHCYTIDANFDGYGDFTFTYLQGNQIYRNHLWVWNEYHKRFEGVMEYDDISVPSLDEETKTIYGFDPTSGGGTGLHTFHQWVEGNLLCMRQIEIEQNVQSKIFHMSIQDRIARELVEIYQEDFAPDSEKWHDAEMVWHDLNYHGEPDGIYDLFQQQPIDNFHDAFLVDTRGKLGTLLVTAELGMESKGEFGLRDITFTVWNPAEMEVPIQTLTEEVIMGVAPEFHHVADANFDGFRDFGYLFHAGNQPNYWHYWLWDEAQEQFIYYAPLRMISQPVFDAEKQVVTGWARDSAVSGVHTIYLWIGGELTLVRRIDKHYPKDDDTQLATVEDLIDGQMIEVYRKEWDLTEIKEGTPLIDWEWYDLEYHGEPE